MNRWSPILLTAAAAFSTSALAVEQLPVDGTWQKHEDIFSFNGITSHYSCVGLETKLKVLLEMVGARPDFKVRGTCTNTLPSSTGIQVARMSFYTLAPPGSPVPAGKLGVSTAPTAEAGRGEWRAIDWTPTSPREFSGGDCELVEQFALEILPVFATRGLESHMDCVPNQAEPSGIHLKFEVLAALPEARR